ncbi:MAG: hypothetical protein WCQ53_06145 [bacterium]
MLKLSIFALTMFFICSASYAQTPAMPSMQTTAPQPPSASPSTPGSAPANAPAAAAAATTDDKNKPSGSAMVEKYVDPDGTVKYKKYRYGYQYSGKTLTADKPEGDIQRKKTTGATGQEEEEGYTWGFQYAKQGGANTGTTSTKPKAQKFQSVKRSPITVIGGGTPAEGAKTETATGTKPATGTTTGTSTNTDSVNVQDVQKKLMEMIKQDSQNKK